MNPYRRWRALRKMRWAVRFLARLSPENRVLFTILRLTQPMPHIAEVRLLKGATWEPVDLSSLFKGGS